MSLQTETWCLEGPLWLRKLRMPREGPGGGNAPGKGREVGPCLGQARARGCRRLGAGEVEFMALSMEET